METYTLTSPAAPTLKKKKKGRYILRRKDTSRLLSLRLSFSILSCSSAPIDGIRYGRS